MSYTNKIISGCLQKRNLNMSMSVCQKSLKQAWSEEADKLSEQALSQIAFTMFDI